MKLTLGRLPIRLATITLLAASYSVSIAFAAVVNLTQSDQVITPVPADARRLATYFSPPYHTGPIPPAIKEILLRNTPPEFRAGCAAMVDSLGNAARGSSRVSIRILAVAESSAWLGWRCDSRVGRFDSAYSEQLAIFSASRATIQFFDLKAPQDTGVTFYHVSFAETLKLRNAGGSAAFELFAVGPGVPATGLSRKAENRFVVIADSATAAKMALALVTARERPGAPSGGTAGGSTLNSDDEYRAAMRFEHDLTGNVTAINVFYRDQAVVPRPRFGNLRYVWNPAAFAFTEAAPIRLPPVGRKPGPHNRPLAY
jgi:hypothetical protein